MGNLKSRIFTHLRQGSINVPGKDALVILADAVGARVPDIKNVLSDPSVKDEITVTHNFIGLKNKQPFVPFSQEGRRQSSFAVDGQGRHYAGTIKPGHPQYRAPSSRQMTRKEWEAAWPGSPYPFLDETSPETIPTEDEVTKLNNGNTQVQRIPVEHRRKQLFGLIRELVGDEQAPNETVKRLAAEYFGVSLATITTDMGHLKKEGLIEFYRTEYQGVLYVRPASEPPLRERLDLVILVLNDLKRNPGRAIGKTVAERTQLPQQSVEGYLLKILKQCEFYGVKRTGFGAWEVDFIIDGPLTDEQWETVNKVRKQSFALLKQYDKAASHEVPDEVPATPTTVTEEAALISDVNELVRSLVERAQADRARISVLEAQLQRQDIRLASLAERVEMLDLLLEVERSRQGVRDWVQTRRVPLLEPDILDAARALLTD